MLMEMDKKAYLEQIAVKGKQQDSTPLFSPKLIKIIAVGLVLLITLLIVGAMLGSANHSNDATYQKLYLRLKNLSASSSPIYKYNDDIRSSTLRAYNSTLRTTLKTQTSDINALLPSTGVDLATIDATVSSEETALVTNFETRLKSGKLNGQFDRTYASETYYQITLLITLEREVATQTDNEQLKATLLNSVQALTKIQESFKNYSDNH